MRQAQGAVHGEAVRIAGRLLGALLLLAGAAPAGAQQAVTQVSGLWNDPYPPFLACHLLDAVPEGLRQTGTAKAYQYAEAATGRSGTLGLDARGGVRYLLVNVSVTTTSPGRQDVATEMATVHFRPDGTVEVGRRGIYHRSSDPATPEASQVYGLSAPEGTAAIMFARRVRTICFDRERGVLPRSP